MSEHDELVERLRAMAEQFAEHSQTSNNDLHRRINFDRAADIRAASTALDALVAENARLKSALEPFAKKAGDYHYEDPQHHGVVFISDLRRARAALAQGGGE